MAAYLDTAKYELAAFGCELPETIRMTTGSGLIVRCSVVIIVLLEPRTLYLKNLINSLATASDCSSGRKCPQFRMVPDCTSSAIALSGAAISTIEPYSALSARMGIGSFPLAAKAWFWIADKAAAL